VLCYTRWFGAGRLAPPAWRTKLVASHSSAVKAHRQSLKNRDRNRHYRSQLRHALKSMRSAMAEGKVEDAKASMSTTVSLIDKLAGKGIIHGNAAGRYKSRPAALP